MKSKSKPTLLEIKEGPLKGEKIPLTEGLTLGREQSDIDLKDPRASRKHAEITKNSKGELVVKDLKSRNGLKIQGKKKSHIILEVGTRFVLGKTEFEVVIAEESETLPEIMEPEADAKEVNEPPPPPKWDEVLVEFSSSAAKNLKNKGKELLAFKPPLQIEFLRGLQADTKWTLGYGPRHVGKKSVDLPIYDEKAPDNCFEVRPTPKGPEFITKHPKVVSLNGEQKKSDILKSGDKIAINGVLLTVSFYDEKD